MSSIKILKPHKGQLEILTDPARFKVVSCGRRYGKTELGKIVVGETSIKYKEQVFWFAPTFKMASQLWRELKLAFEPIIGWKSEQQMTIEFKTGGELRIFSGENFETFRGLKPYRVIVDEAAMFSDPDMWHAVIRPALSDKKGEAYFLSTPRGRNWFYDLYVMGQDKDNEDYKSWSMPSWKNPHIPKSELLKQLQQMPEKLFQQEILAQFLLDAGEVFRGVIGVSKGVYMTPYKGRFAMGIDLGRKNDFTVIVIFDMNTRTMVDMVRFSKLDWTTQKTYIKQYYDTWKPVTCLIEDNKNDSIIEDLQKDGYRVSGFNTNKRSKPQIIEQMAVAIQNGNIVLLNDKELVFEFQAFQMNVTPTGNIKYAAPLGFHDDIVLASCIAFEGVARGASTFGSVLPILSGWSSN